jgi:hypothetical protein
MPILTGNVDSDKQRLKLEEERKKKTAETPIEQLIAEAIERGVTPPEREPQEYRTHPNSFLDYPVAKDISRGRLRWPLNYKGEMEFKRSVRYESEQGSLMIRKLGENTYWSVMTLNKEEFVSAQIIFDDFGEPKFLIVNPSYSGTGRLLWRVKLHGDLFTPKQKQAWKDEVRSKKIASLESEVESLKAQLQETTDRTKELQKQNEELKKNLDHCESSKISSKLKRLLPREKPETEIS